MPPRKRKSVDAEADDFAEDGNGSGPVKKVNKKKPAKKNKKNEDSDNDEFDDEAANEVDAPVVEEEEEEEEYDDKIRIPAPDTCGTFLLCGATNWDMIGRKDLPKNTKNLGGRNLWGPHKYPAMNGIKIRSVVSGSQAAHALIITAEGKVMTFGRNDKGQLGHGDLKRRDIPTVVEALEAHNCVAAAMGRNHTLVLTDRGRVFAFGDNKNGQCGVNSKDATILAPKKLSWKGKPIVKMACGAEFSLVVDMSGHLYSFGLPEYGQLGHNTDGKFFLTSTKLGYHNELAPRRIPVFVEKGRDGHVSPVTDEICIVDVACGTNHSLAVDNKKRCYSWGFGGYGRLGHAEPKDELVPRLVKAFDGPNRGVKSVYAGGTYSIAINEFGCLYLWGQTKSAGEATMYPKPIQDLSGWQLHGVGTSNRSIVVLGDESVISWGGSPTFGELGYGENKPKSSTTPQEVKPLDGLKIHSVTCGQAFTLFIAREETDEDKAKLDKLPEYVPQSLE